MQPFHELPVVVGFPADCSSMGCAEVYTNRITAAGLQQFVADRLLRLARLPPVGPRLLGAGTEGLRRRLQAWSPFSCVS